MCMNIQQGILFVVSGPSGVGKTTLVNLFLKTYGQKFFVKRVITYTTRGLRPGDVHGVDYHFVSESEFLEKIKIGFFLEWSNAYGAYYGTSREILVDIESGQSQIVVIDRAGARAILGIYDKAVLVWVCVSSIKILSDRLFLRKSESFEQIQLRLSLAKKEIDEENHEPLYHFKIVNDSLNIALQSTFEVFESSLKSNLFCKKKNFL